MLLKGNLFPMVIKKELDCLPSNYQLCRKYLLRRKLNVNFFFLNDIYMETVR